MILNFCRTCQQSLSLSLRQRKKCGEDLDSGGNVTASLKLEVIDLSKKLTGKKKTIHYVV